MSKYTQWNKMKPYLVYKINNKIIFEHKQPGFRTDKAWRNLIFFKFLFHTLKVCILGKKNYIDILIVSNQQIDKGSRSNLECFETWKDFFVKVEKSCSLATKEMNIELK